jgi:hypothetical protein
MGRAFLILLAISGCNSDASPSQDASAVQDASANVDGEVGRDAAPPDLNPCPNTYVNSGSCPHPGLACLYFEAACFCDDQVGMWFCCSNSGSPACLQLTMQPPPNTGDGCNLNNMPCQWACVNGTSKVCTCDKCRWQCTTTPCVPDGGAGDGG